MRLRRCWTAQSGIQNRSCREAILEASTITRGLPSILPLARAFRSPARTRSWIRARSNSAMAPIIWNMSRPEGVLKSMLSLRLTNATPSAASSARALTKCFSERPKRSIFQTRMASNRRRQASDISRFSAGRDSLQPDTPWSVNSSMICQPRRPAYSRSSASCISGS
jgi:hypothetical protein